MVKRNNAVSLKQIVVLKDSLHSCYSWWFSAILNFSNLIFAECQIAFFFILSKGCNHSRTSVSKGTMSTTSSHRLFNTSEAQIISYVGQGSRKVWKYGIFWVRWHDSAIWVMEKVVIQDVNPIVTTGKVLFFVVHSTKIKSKLPNSCMICWIYYPHFINFKCFFHCCSYRVQLPLMIILPYLPLYKSIPCISWPPFWSQKISFSYFWVRTFLKNLSFILAFSFKYAMVTRKIWPELYFDLSFWPTYKSRAIFWIDFYTVFIIVEKSNNNNYKQLLF